MLFKVSYESARGVIEDYDVTVEDFSTIGYDALLLGRNICNIYLKDIDTLVWIRIPSLKVLRYFLSAFEDGTTEVSIIFRERDGSPNRSNHSGPSSNETDFTECAMNKGYICDDVQYSIGNIVEPFTMEDVAKISRSELLILPDEENPNTAIGIHAPSLLAYIKSEIFDGKHLYDITVQAQSNNQILNIKLTKNIWTTYLLRGNVCSDIFLDFMATSLGNVTLFDKRLLELHQNVKLWNKVKFFHNDLMSFGQNFDAQKRLESDPTAFYFMSSIYFSESETEYLLSFPTACGLSCRAFLDALIRTIIGADGINATLCISHDLATAIAELYGIRKEYTKDKEFKKFCKEFVKK